MNRKKEESMRRAPLVASHRASPSMRTSLPRASTRRPPFTGTNQRHHALSTSSRVMRVASTREHDDVNVIGGVERLSTEYQTFLYVRARRRRRRRRR